MATPAHEWPTNQKKYRNQAAERVNKAVVKLDGLIDGKPHKDEEMLLIVANTQKDLFAALRWLERAGACTQPEEL